MSIDSNIAEELVSSGGPPAHKFEDIGDRVTIRIESIEKTAQTDFATGEALTWPNGDTKWQFVISGVDTATGEPTRVFAKGQMLSAVKEALRAAEAKPETGGELTIKFDSEEPSQTRGFNPRKIYKAKYVAPAPVADIDDL
jgi:hypothetical protein